MDRRGNEYNRGTGCGKTARPGLCGRCRETGIPTTTMEANLEDSIQVYFKGKSVGIIKSPENDTWYFFGKYIPKNNDIANRF